MRYHSTECIITVVFIICCYHDNESLFSFTKNKRVKTNPLNVGSYLWKRKESCLDLGARQHAHTLEPQDHKAVADSYDEDGHDEGKDEYADLQQGVPVPGWVGENHLAINGAVGYAEVWHTRVFICLQRRKRKFF